NICTHTNLGIVIFTPNVLVTEDGHLKLTDFNLSKIFDRNEKDNLMLGTYDYMAPEIFKNSHDKNVDWWSLGVLTYTLFYGFEPYSIADVIETNQQNDSVRVDGIAQCATILDVQLKTVQKEDGKAENLAKIKQMTDEIEDLEIKIVLINNFLRTLHFQAPLLDKTLSNIEKATLKTVKEEEQFCFDSSTQQSLLNLFAFHEKQSTELSTKYEQSQLEKKIMASKIEELKQNISLLERECFAVKCIFITLHTEFREWDTQPAPRSSLFGGGMPTCTGSAAVEHSSVPLVPVYNDLLLLPPHPQNRSPRSHLSLKKHFLSKAFYRPFTIAKKKTIPSSSLSNEHRVTVTEVELDDPVLHYDCHKLSFVGGPASIFMDNCFSSKMKLKTINSGEKFSVPLGTDPSVQLRYGVCSYRKEGLFQSNLSASPCLSLFPSLRIKRLRSHLICPFGKIFGREFCEPST
uniref:Protein kinase domain-containing protein n=1 Tax=Ditylenchus dipsaci TaxID=166011 RepID=A0A915DY34_9BILA